MPGNKWREYKTCATRTSLTKLAPLIRRIGGKCSNAARLHHQRAETARQQHGQALVSAGCVAPSRTLNLSTVKPTTYSTTEATRGHWACVHTVSGGPTLADPGISTEPRGLTEAQSRLADRLIFSLPLLSRGAARLWTCVCGILHGSSSPRGCSTSNF